MRRNDRCILVKSRRLRMRFWDDSSWILPMRICMQFRRVNPRRCWPLAVLLAIPFCFLSCGNQKHPSASARAIQVSIRFNFRANLESSLGSRSAHAGSLARHGRGKPARSRRSFRGTGHAWRGRTNGSRRSSHLGYERGRQDLDISFAQGRSLVERPARHSRRFRLRLAPPGGPGNGV